MKTAKSILLVEDDQDDQIFFIEALSEIENATLYDVANNGKEALDRLQNQVMLPDLIFMDINMPMMNGIECLTEIIKNPKTTNIPVVMLTTDTGRIELARKSGAKAFIKKPSDGKTLRGQLQQMISLDFIADCHIANQTFQTAVSAF
jgi:CheY-like chemotaxis protein